MCVKLETDHVPAVDILCTSASMDTTTSFSNPVLGYLMKILNFNIYIM